MTSVGPHCIGLGVGEKVQVCTSLSLKLRPQEPLLQPAL